MSDAAILALIAMVSSVAGLIMQTMKNRDQLKYDVKLAVLEDRQKRCEEDGLAKSVRIASLESHIVTLTATDVKDRVELEAKITAVKDQSNPGPLPVVQDKR